MPRPRTINNPFPKTRWSVVASVDHVDLSVRHNAFEKLCRAYWPPLYGFARMKGVTREDAEDLVQGYFCKLLTNESIRNANENLGNFRTYLLRGFKNFMLDDWRMSKAKRRGGGEAIVFSIDSEEVERTLDLSDDHSLSPEEAFDRNWTKMLLNQTLIRLREKFEAKGKLGDYEAMLPFLGTSSEPSYQETAQALGRTIESTRVYVQRFRAAYQQCIRSELSDTLKEGADIEVELRSLFQAFSKR